jgi:glutathione S-transferase
LIPAVTTLHLISFAVCPYVQRALIALCEKQVEHQTTYIDLNEKPEWFLKISPRGKVPVLLVDDVPCSSRRRSESPTKSVRLRLLPDDPSKAARDRGWFQFAEDVFSPSTAAVFA